MTEFLKHQLEVYFIENPDDAARIAEQVLINKRSRENAASVQMTILFQRRPERSKVFSSLLERLSTSTPHPSTFITSTMISLLKMRL